MRTSPPIAATVFRTVEINGRCAFRIVEPCLSNSESLVDAGRSELAGLSEITQAHFLGDYFSRAVLDLLPLGWTQLPNYFIHVHGHGYVPFPLPTSKLN